MNDTLEALVRQFSQPLAFLRELVQNSIDARSNRIDIEVGEAEESGMARISVKDTGEGMNAEIIDRSLTRLFASSKENDLTKVGKFGIGFVSVFAINPEAVVVDTGRDGESWRLIFHPDKSFDKIALDEPVEGCQVNVYLKMIARKVPDLSRRCAETVRFWCRHCRVDIFMNGERLNEEFGFSEGFQVRRELEGTRIAVQAVGSDKPTCGFYNQGLTLLEKDDSGIPSFAFKLDSRYLEHTLTRDNVMQDEHYRKAMAQLKQVIEVQFPEELAARMEADPERADWEAVCNLLLCKSSLPERLQNAAMWPIHPNPRFTSQKISYKQLCDQPTLLQEQSRTPLLEALMRTSRPPAVLLGGLGSPWWKASQFSVRRPVDLSEHYWLAEMADVPAETSELLKAAARVARLTLLWPGRWVSKPQNAVVRLSTGYLHPGIPRPFDPESSKRKDLRVVMLDVDHPSLPRLLKLSSQDTSLAVSMLSHRILLEQGWVADVRNLADIFDGAAALRR